MCARGVYVTHHPISDPSKTLGADQKCKTLIDSNDAFPQIAGEIKDFQPGLLLRASNYQHYGFSEKKRFNSGRCFVEMGTFAKKVSCCKHSRWSASFEALRNYIDLSENCQKKRSHLALLTYFVHYCSILGRI